LNEESSNSSDRSMFKECLKKLNKNEEINNTNNILNFINKNNQFQNTITNKNINGKFCQKILMISKTIFCFL
jgi:hypothetical protein